MDMQIQEYCLAGANHWSTCMTKAEWSGWMQAIGALIALGIAIWVSGRPERSEKRYAVIKARVFARSLVECMQGMSYGVQKNEIGMLVMSRVAIKELVAVSQSNRSELLPAPAMQAFINLRVNAIQILEAAKAYETRHEEEARTSFITMLEFYAGRANFELQVLFTKHNCVPAEHFDAAAAAAQVISAAEAMVATRTASSR